MKTLTGAAIAVLLPIAVSCSKDVNPAGLQMVQTEVRLMDAPLSGVQSVNVYIDHIDASTTTDTAGGADQQPWTVLVAPHKRYDLLTLQNGNTALLGTTQLSAAQYKAIRVVLDTDSSNVVRTDGSLAPVRWGSAGQFSISVLVEAPVQVSGQNAQILLDFNVANSFVPDPTNAAAFLFIPWIRAVPSGS